MGCKNSKASAPGAKADKIGILHFNDVYDIEDRDLNAKSPDGKPLKAGAARLATAMRERGSAEKLVLFSGDIFGGSNLSMHFKGEQMVGVLKRLRVDVNCLGNHDLDFGIDRFKQLCRATGQPWLMANLLGEDGKSVAGLPSHHVLTHRGVRVGLFGVCEEEWLGLMNPFELPEELQYVDFVETSKRMSKLLKKKKCDLIIALTHMRVPNDRILAAKCQGEIDLILGGHDHSTVNERIGTVTLVKSGCDFEEFSDISINVATKEIATTLVQITEEFEPDPDMEAHIALFAEELNRKL